MTELVVRALLPEDAAAARALVAGQFGGTRHEPRALELLELAIAGGEQSGVLAVASGGAGALLVRTVVAGAQGVARVDYVAGDAAAMRAAVEWSLARDAEAGMRLLVAEVPSDGAFGPTAECLRAAGFVEEGRVADFFADGVALRLLVLPVTPREA